MPNRESKPYQKLIKLLERIEDGILISLLLLMIFMAVLQIALRNLFEAGILWGDPLIRVLVLWIGLIGAMVASRTHNHISIDIVSRYLPDTGKKISKLVISIFTAGICAIMTYYSYNFVMMEKLDGIRAFSSVPAWICEAIIPFAFAVICLRYLFFVLSSLTQLFSKAEK